MLKWGHTWGLANAVPAAFIRSPPTTIREKPALFFFIKHAPAKSPYRTKNSCLPAVTLYLFVRQKKRFLWASSLVHLAWHLCMLRQVIALERFIVQKPKDTFSFKPGFLFLRYGGPSLNSELSTTPTLITVYVCLCVLSSLPSVLSESRSYVPCKARKALSKRWPPSCF